MTRSHLEEARQRLGEAVACPVARWSLKLLERAASVTGLLGFLLGAAPAYAADVPLGPLLHLSMEDGAGSSVVTDSSGNGLDGQLVNMDPTTDWVTGVAGLALDFDGVDDFVEVTDDPLLDFGVADFSVSYWAFKRMASANFDDIYGVSKWSTGAARGTNEWALTMGTGNSNEISDRPGFHVEVGTTGHTARSPDELTLNEWHHLVGVREAERLRMYVDGVLKAETVIPQCSPAVNNVGRDLTIARNQDTGFLPASNAILDDVQIYAYALDDGGVAVGETAGGEIAELFTNPGQTIVRSTTTTTMSTCPGTCGDANDDGMVTASDALIALKTAVGQLQCLPCICDLNATLTITATDALEILRFAVGSLCSLSCPPAG